MAARPHGELLNFFDRLDSHVGGARQRCMVGN